MRGRPVSERRSITSILVSVGIHSGSIWKPSRGPTSQIVTLFGSFIWTLPHLRPLPPSGGGVHHAALIGDGRPAAGPRGHAGTPSASAIARRGSGALPQQPPMIRTPAAVRRRA